MCGFSEESNFEGMIGKSKPMRKLFELIKKYTEKDSNVLILGESGTGKELVANAIHKRSRRCGHPFIAVNCAEFTEELIGTELFGHEKGAFTGADQRKPGRFELAKGGTIFLDEIGDASLSLQAKLLRVIQEKQFQRLGGTKTIDADFRLITATNKNLSDMVTENRFREDLLYRLNVLPITIPPLRDRKKDIPLLIEHFIKKVKDENSSSKAIKFSQDAVTALCKYDWPGNVRELENVIEQLVTICDGEIAVQNVLEIIGTPNTLNPTGDCCEKFECLFIEIMEEENVLFLTEGSHTLFLKKAVKQVGIKWPKNTLILVRTALKIYKEHKNYFYKNQYAPEKIFSIFLKNKSFKRANEQYQIIDSLQADYDAFQQKNSLRPEEFNAMPDGAQPIDFKSLNVSKPPIPISVIDFYDQSIAPAKDYYNGALSEVKMREVYKDAQYAKFNLLGYKIPYTVLVSFFNNDIMPYMDFGSLKFNYEPRYNTHIIPKTHPLNKNNSILINSLKQAYKFRRWDNLETWGNTQTTGASSTNRSLIKISSFNIKQRRIGFSETDYDSQAVTNLVIDMEVEGDTLRKYTYQGKKLPELSNPFLANNLGISILFLSEENMPIFPLRNNKGVAIFPNEWGCTVSFAADFPDSGKFSNTSTSAAEVLDTAIRNQLEKELDIHADKVELIPLALCREWFRCGKPQLFMAVESNFSIQEVINRYQGSQHSNQVADIGPNYTALFHNRQKHVWDFKPTKSPHSIEALMNLMLYEYYKLKNMTKGFSLPNKLRFVKNI